MQSGIKEKDEKDKKKQDVKYMDCQSLPLHNTKTRTNLSVHAGFPPIYYLFPKITYPLFN